MTLRSNAISDQRLFAQFCDFAKSTLRSGDFDPNYLLLREVFDARNYGSADRLEHILCFLGTSHLRSGEELFFRVRARGHVGDTTAVVKNTQRRGFRGNDLLAVYWEGTRKIGLELVTGIVERYSPTQAWTALREVFESVPYGGPYHSYKFCDLLKYCLGLRITAPDIGVGGGGRSAGPIPGLSRLTGRPWDECARSRQLQDDVFDLARSAGVPYPGREEFETTLCDFDKFAKGRYYVGENLDGQMEIISGLDATYWEGRARRFPAAFLGEVGGWFGVRKEKRESRK